MTKEGRRSKIVQMIENNLWAILAAAGAAYGGYLTGTTTTDLRLAELEADVVEIRADLKTLTPRVDRVEVTTAMEREERMKGDGK